MFTLKTIEIAHTIIDQPLFAYTFMRNNNNNSNNNDAGLSRNIIAHRSYEHFSDELKIVAFILTCFGRSLVWHHVTLQVLRI